MRLRLFDLAAPFYDRLTANRLWRESVREMARHFPPSGTTLRLLDIGCGAANSALELLRLRPDLYILGLDRSAERLRQAQRKLRSAQADQVRLLLSDACYVPLPDSSMDAITAHSVYSLLTNQVAFLVESMRVLRPGGRLILFDPMVKESIIPGTVARTLENAGFARVLGERAVNGYGVLSRGEKPYIAQRRVERIADAAALEIDSMRGRHLFLLIQQTPNKPVWALKTGEVITWGAATVNDNGKPVALAFSSLPKAVAFMQPAVLAGVLISINKVAKFDKTTATQWDFPILINPSLDNLRESSQYTLPGNLIGIDPASAITGDE